MILITFKQTVILLILMAAGFACTKAGILDDRKNEGLTDLLLYVLTPCMLISRFQVERDAQHMSGLLVGAATMIITFTATIIVCMLLFRKKDDKSVVTAFGCIYPNNGYMGLPLVEGLFGSVGGFYGTAPVALFHVFAFTHGVLLMKGKDGRIDLKKIILTPSIIAVILGFIMFFCRIRLPEVIDSPITMLGNCMSPLAMVVSGHALANIDFKKIRDWKEIGITCLMRLVVLPVLIVLLASLIPGDATARTVVAVMMSCPTAAFTVIFSIKYGRDSVLASELFAVTTILSIISIPLIAAFAGIMIY